MKKKKHGLSGKEIQTMFSNRKTKKITSPHLSIFFIQENPKEVSRVSFVVSKKEVRSATQRNKIKRRSRYIFGKIKNLRKGYKYVVHFKSSAVTLPFSHLEEELNKNLKKTNTV